jgi:hypothetical protein
MYAGVYGVYGGSGMKVKRTEYIEIEIKDVKLKLSWTEAKELERELAAILVLRTPRIVPWPRWEEYTMGPGDHTGSPPARWEPEVTATDYNKIINPHVKSEI